MKIFPKYINEEAKDMPAVSMSNNSEVIKCIVPSAQKK